MLGRVERAAAKTRGKLWRLPQGYPALELGGDDWVYGELVQPVSDSLLALVDKYEGVDEGLYQRLDVDVVVGLRVVSAWTYAMVTPKTRGGILIPSGRYTSVTRR